MISPSDIFIMIVCALCGAMVGACIMRLKLRNFGGKVK